MQHSVYQIDSGSALTDVIDLQHYLLTGIIMPGSWTTANLTFAASAESDGTFVPVYDDAGTEYTVTAAASRCIQIDPVKLAGARYIKVRSGTSGSPVNQGADRLLTLVLRTDG